MIIVDIYYKSNKSYKSDVAIATYIYLIHL